LALDSKLNSFNELKRTYNSLSANTTQQMPNFIVQKMENLVKRWNELEANSLNNIGNDTASSVCEKKSSKKNDAPEPPKTLPVKMFPSKSGSISSSSPSSPPRYSDEITPVRDVSLDAISNVSSASKTVKTTKITTTETIMTEEKLVMDAKVSEEMQAYTNTFVFKEESQIKNANIFEETKSINTVTAVAFTDLNSIGRTEHNESQIIQFKKTPSIDSIKSKTIVTPFELEPNNVEDFNVISKDLNIIKLENETNLTSLLNDDSFERIDGSSKSNALLDVTKSVSFSDSIKTDQIINNSSSIGDDPKDDIDLISNDLFDWLLWIDHTLESQLVTVGDLEEINQGIQKFEYFYGYKTV
jgi:hypothetical protein